MKKQQNARLRKRIIEFLNDAASQVVLKRGTAELKHGLGCVLATAGGRRPRATPVDFFSDGLTIYIAGDPGRKIANIRSNPRVAVGIYHPLVTGELNRSLQVQGSARLINYREHRRTFLNRIRKIGLLDILEQSIKRHTRQKNLSAPDAGAHREKMLGWFNLIQIEPDEITFLYMHPTEGYEKGTWKRQTKK